MILIRKDKSFTADPENPEDYWREVYQIEQIKDDEMSEVQVDFKDFGRGSQRRPDFAVKVNWTDVQGFMAAFIEMRHPGALHLRRLIKLVEAIEGAGWRSDDVPEEVFVEFLKP